MSRRSKAREIALQMLFQHDMNPDVGAKTVRLQIAERIKDESLRKLAWDLYAGTMESRPEIDSRIEAAAENWELARMAATDRNTLRLGVFELHYTDTPHQVVIDEAVELARKFGSAQSPQFVNGLLDRLVPKEKRESSGSA
jgi:N utilization substance protein B